LLSEINNKGSGYDDSLTWKLRGEDVTIDGVKITEIEYVKRPRGECDILRSDFDNGIRKEFLIDLC